MSHHCYPCDLFFRSDETLQEHKRESGAHIFDCRDCDRHYCRWRSLRQHLRASPAHLEASNPPVKPVRRPFDFAACACGYSRDTVFEGLLRKFPVHASLLNCGDCNQSFNSEQALIQHFLDPLAHAPSIDCENSLPSFNCENCNRSFSSEQVLQHHLQDSPAYSLSFICAECNQSFPAEEALQEYLRDSPVDNPAFDCKTCNRPFRNKRALQ